MYMTQVLRQNFNGNPLEDNIRIMMKASFSSNYTTSSKSYQPFDGLLFIAHHQTINHFNDKRIKYQSENFFFSFTFY